MLFQFEGAYLSDGKGLSNWDVYTHKPGETTSLSLSLSTDLVTFQNLLNKSSISLTFRKGEIMDFFSSSIIDEKCHHRRSLSPISVFINYIRYVSLTMTNKDKYINFLTTCNHVVQWLQHVKSEKERKKS
jgi:hypothetical protein